LDTLILTSCAAFWSKKKLWEILFFRKTLNLKWPA
jgi:hypothetical protein